MKELIDDSPGTPTIREPEATLREDYEWSDEDKAGVDSFNDRAILIDDTQWVNLEFGEILWDQ